MARSDSVAASTVAVSPWSLRQRLGKESKAVFRSLVWPRHKHAGIVRGRKELTKHWVNVWDPTFIWG